MDVIPGAARVAPVAAGAAGLSSGVYLAVVDPSAPGSRFPTCSFHQLTGLWCPGCGLTRATHELLNGNVIAALGHNLFVPVAMAAVLVGWWCWWCRARGRQLPRWVVPMVTRAAPVAAVLVIAYGVLRNVPVAPFADLAP